MRKPFWFSSLPRIVLAGDAAFDVVLHVNAHPNKPVSLLELTQCLVRDTVSPI